MATFAHIGDGKALDPQVNNTLNDYLLRYTAVVVYGWLTAGQQVISVPDGTEHGATDNGDGTYTNPPMPEVPAP